jgi:hypothetical protein
MGHPELYLTYTCIPCYILLSKAYVTAYIPLVFYPIQMFK